MNASTAIVNTMTTTTPKVFTIASESVFTIPRSGVHLSSQSVFIFRRNTQPARQRAPRSWIASSIVGEITALHVVLDQALERYCEYLDMRIDPEAKDLIRRAAKLKGQRVLQYVNATVVAQARADIAEANVATVSPQAFARILDDLDNPPAPNHALRRAMAEYHGSE